jgi:hypothetical protein
MPGVAAAIKNFVLQYKQPAIQLAASKILAEALEVK